MGVRVIDLRRDDRSEKCDWWNWRPTVALMRAIRSGRKLGVLGGPGARARAGPEEAEAPEAPRRAVKSKGR